MTSLAETYDRLWSPLLETIRADALDCLQANLAVLADRHGEAGAHLSLGAPLRFDLEPGPRVAASLPYRLAAAHETLGLRVARRWDGIDGARLRALADEAGPLYVIADAHGLTWTPYAGRRHTEHTFLLSTSDTVVDAYHDETPWGPCRPGVWRLSPSELDAMLPTATALRFTAEPIAEQSDVLAVNAKAMADAVPAIDAYLAADHGDGLVLDIWLLGRSRLLHGAWLARYDRPSPEVDEHAKAWLTLASKSYVASRRSRTGAPGTAVLDDLGRLLHEDVAIAARLAARHTTRAAVLAVIQDVLRIDEPTVRAATTLRELPNYNSFGLVDIIERVETRLAVVLDDEDLTPQALQDIDSLCAIFARRVEG
ncbi:acyl carrier protein [Amycolatopsis sp. WAC 01375]|uniref:acyl carrier protein n=1 Tax=Amycolatopsis sp. WAC 01375 TaxID=2203194 RepID=UPI0018F6BD98|nr:acyl carrier protein [Amycolatopsis sp. WAC 01375]